MASKGRVLPSSSLTLLPVSILCLVRLTCKRTTDAPPWQLNFYYPSQRTILSRLPLYFSLFDSFPPSQCGFYQKLKDYCRVFPQINNESIAKPSSRFVDSNGPHTTLCYHSAKGHFAASEYSWIFGKRKFIVFMNSLPSSHANFFNTRRNDVVSHKLNVQFYFFTAFIG